jgi:RepB DNA-primase from phage plasmid
MESLTPELQNPHEANRMLDIFASVGARRFDVTFLDIEGAKRGFRKDQSVRQLKNSLSLLFPGLKERQNSLVVRPHSEEAALIQLDDLNRETLAPLRDVSFLSLQTSPGNYQAWVAVSGLSDPKDFSRRLRKGSHADPTASGATRVAGTLNFKRKYEPDFPAVAIAGANPGRIVTAEQLETLGLLAPLPAAPAAPLRVSRSSSRNWPDYQRCVQGAPMNHAQTGPDLSRADFFWSMMAAQRGFGIDAIASRLMELSSKAQENGELYARMTAENATAAVSRDMSARRAR